MKFYRYWVREAGEVSVDGKKKTVHCYGGSDVSEVDAREKAGAKFSRLQRRIAGHEDAFEEYETAIREEIVRHIDSKNVITRTRYGALILNSEDTFFIDIDKPPQRFWKNLFAWRGLSGKERIVANVAEFAALREYAQLGFRVYETHSGMRVIISGTQLTADHEDALTFFYDLNADPLYMKLCEKQRCFRARLSAKPERVGVKRVRVEFPRDAPAQAALDAWLPVYEAANAGYAVCRFVKEFGVPQRSRIIDLHDELCRANSKLPLA